MPIQTENTKLSIDFAYEWSSPDGATFTYQMRFMHSEAGPVIQIANGHESLEFPAAMFTETAEFLASQGVLGPRAVASKKTFGGALALPTISKKTSIAPAPMQTPQMRKPAAKSNVVPFQNLGDQSYVEGDGDDDGVEMMEPPVHSQAQIGERPRVTGKEGVTEEEAEQLKRERLAAKAKAKSDDKKTKRLGSNKDDDE